MQTRFERDGNGRIAAQGQFSVDCQLACQRCLQALSQTIESAFTLTFVADEKAAEALPDEYDPVILDENGNIHVVDLLEDEMVLRLPVAPKHADEAVCRSFGYPGEAALTEADSTQTGQSGRKNPFDVLKDFSKPD
ncbi:YceD family protein [Granulosicoccaceae sp. 1_MG-2023]|nr:YceD family protein [Granulosicoccaceae sp. 1_MG-2023]